MARPPWWVPTLVDTLSRYNDPVPRHRSISFPGPDLLSVDREHLRPLAERMRPRTLDEMVGQKRLLAPDSALRRAVESGRVHSMILWGPPGCGKTTLALLLAEYSDAEFRAISAVLSGLPEVRQVLAEAAQRFAEGRRTVLFVDEVHRFNKAQQDAFLPHIERGTILFVGHHRESVVRTELGVAVALPRACAGGRLAHRHRRSTGTCAG